MCTIALHKRKNEKRSGWDSHASAMRESVRQSKRKKIENKMLLHVIILYTLYELHSYGLLGIFFLSLWIQYNRAI